MNNVGIPYVVEWQLRNASVDLARSSLEALESAPRAAVYADGMRVLLVEDDAVVADAVQRAMARGGFAVDRVGSATHARTALDSDRFDLAIVDIGLPDQDGLQLVRAWRRAGKSLPVMMLTARDGLSDRVGAFDLGADDYLTKPFEVLELLARARSLIRRANGLSQAKLVVGALSLDLTRREATRAGVPLELTAREWSILECLALNAGHFVTKERLIGSVAGWGDDITSNAIEVYVSRLRAKLGDAARIRGIRGLGYRLDDSPG